MKRLEPIDKPIIARNLIEALNKAKLTCMDLGLWKTFRALDKATTAIGYEVAENLPAWFAEVEEIDSYD